MIHERKVDDSHLYAQEKRDRYIHTAPSKASVKRFAELDNTDTRALQAYSQRYFGHSPNTHLSWGSGVVRWRLTCLGRVEAREVTHLSLGSGDVRCRAG